MLAALLHGTPAVGVSQTLWHGTRDGIIMAALRSRCRHYIFAPWFLLSFFRRLILAVGDWMSIILPHMVWPLCEFRMQVWNVLHAAHWKCRMQKIAKNSPSAHHRATSLGYILATKVHTNSWKKLVKQQYLLQMSSQYGELRPTSGWDRSGSLGHPCEFWRVLRLGTITAWYYSSGCQPNFAASNRGHHLYSARQPSRWDRTSFLL